MTTVDRGEGRQSETLGLRVERKEGREEYDRGEDALTFFLRRGVPLPPIRTWAWSFFSFSGFML